MSLRFLKWLGLVFVVLLGAWIASLYHQVPHGKNPFAKALDAADHLQLQKGAGQIFLQKEKKDWRVAETSGGPYYPVDEERRRTLESALRNLQLDDVLSERAEKAASFQVDSAAGLRIAARGGDKVLAEGVVGKQAPDGNHLYFRYADQPTIYLAHGLFPEELGGTSLSVWRHHDLVTLAEGAITQFTITQKSGSFTVEKTSNTWSIAGRPADSDKVNTWLGAFAHLRADDFVDSVSTSAPKAADLKEAIVTAKSAEGSSVTLQVGPLDVKGKRFPVSTASEFGIAWVSEPRMRAVLPAAADLLKK